MRTLSHVVDDFEVHKIDVLMIKFGKYDIYPQYPNSFVKVIFKVFQSFHCWNKILVFGTTR